MKFLKRQGFGFWLSLITLIVAIAAFGIYNQVIVAGDGLVIASGSEPFYESSTEIYTEMVSAMQTYVLGAVVLLVVALLIGQFKGEGASQKQLTSSLALLESSFPCSL